MIQVFFWKFSHKIETNTLSGSFCPGARLQRQAGTGTCYLDTEQPRGHQHTAAPPLPWCQKQCGAQTLGFSLFLQNWLCTSTVHLLQEEKKRQFFNFINSFHFNSSIVVFSVQLSFKNYFKIIIKQTDSRCWSKDKPVALHSNDRVCTWPQFCLFCITIDSCMSLWLCMLLLFMQRHLISSRPTLYQSPGMYCTLLLLF